jgi:hypothetical protein|tara:strand:+ start:1144 stop:2322 length:1179 start_codon:yes stop_codon:yes gene_type:complete
MKPYYILLMCLVVFSCSKDEESAASTVTQTVTPPETFDSWTPDFNNQISNFNQTRSGSQGTDQTRAITVTSSQDIEISNETALDEDFNSDGDKLDMYNVVNTVYTASQSLGTHSILSYELSFNQDANIINSNVGTWAGGYNTEDYYGDVESNGNLAYVLVIDGFTLFQDFPDTCYRIIDQVAGAELLADRINKGGFGESYEDDYELILSSSVAYVSLYYNIPANDLFTESYLESWELDYVNNFDVWNIVFRWTNPNGVEFVSYYQIYYDTERNYVVGPWGNEDEIIDWAENSDIFDWSFLSNNSQSAIDLIAAAEVCDTGKNYNSKSINFSNNYPRKLNKNIELRERKFSSSNMTKGYSKTTSSKKSFAKSVHEDLKKLTPTNQKINLKLNK